VQTSHDLAMQALTWLHMILFRVIWFGTIWFGASRKFKMISYI